MPAIVDVSYKVKHFNEYTEKMVLLKHLKIWPDTNLKIINLKFKNNFIRSLK